LARLVRELIERCRQLTEQIHNVGAELDILVEQLAPTLLTICGCGTLHEALKARMADLPPTLLRSITRDQGAEMARHLTIARSLGARVYFCDSRSPWQRGSNENSNGLLRDYVPKGTDLSTHSIQHLLAVENELNTGPDSYSTTARRPNSSRRC
jgi:hypothetical protein